MNDYNHLLLEIASILNNAKTIAISGHVMPDGDCLGSMLALGLALQEIGKKVVLLSPDPVPELYSFLPGVDNIRLQTNPQEHFDVFVAVDCSVPDRLGIFQELLHRVQRVIIIDHHMGAIVFGHVYLNDPDAAAVGEIIFDLIKILNLTMDLDMAACLYVAMVTDTGSFRYDNTGAKTHVRVAELLQMGLQTSRINKFLYEEKPLISIQLLREVLKTFNISACGRIAWMSVDRDTLQRLNATDEHVDGMINYPRMIKGVELALFYRELEKNKYKISFRSKYYLNVNKLASVFGGGGHARAAGCIMEGSLEQIQNKVHTAAFLSLRDDDS